MPIEIIWSPTALDHLQAIYEYILADNPAAALDVHEEIERTVTTALEPGELSIGLAERCCTQGDLGVQHVVVIARGRPFTTTASGAGRRRRPNGSSSPIPTC